MLRKLTKNDVTITIEITEADARIRGNCLASGDDALDEECARDIERQLRNGNAWAWCDVKVTARWRAYEGHDYLGSCSYDSEAQFVADGYYADMVTNAIDDLNEALASADRDLSVLR